MNTDIVVHAGAIEDCAPPTAADRHAIYAWRRAQIDVDDELPPCDGEAIRDITYDIHRAGCGVED